MPERDNPPSADALALAAAKAAKKGPPPVHLWNPPFCGAIDMRIARDGTWFYMGTPIGRPEMVKLFASVLRRDGDDYFVEDLDGPFEHVDVPVRDGVECSGVDGNAHGSFTPQPGDGRTPLTFPRTS